MKIYFNNGFRIRDSGEPKFLWMMQEKEALENISNICARIRHKELFGKSVFRREK